MTRTRSAVVISFNLPPPKRGSTNVPQTDAGDGARFAGGDVAEKVSNHPLRQVIGFNPVGHGQLLQLGHQAPVAANDPTDQTVMAQVVEATLLAIALPGCVDQRQVARAAETMQISLLAFEKALLQGNSNILGKADADEAARSDGVAILDQANSIAGRNDFAGIGSAQRGSHRVR
jgi:hypothetical protein